jgi:hypothetical protein
MVAGTHNALTVEVEVSDAKLVMEVWKDFMKDYDGKTKKAKGGDEMLTTEAEIVGINGVNPLQIYARCADSPAGGVEHTVWFNLGDEYLSSNRQQQYAEAEKLLLKFAHEVKKEKTRRELDEAEKKLKDLTNDLDKLKRQNKGYHDDIAEAEKKIQQAKENIVKNEEQQTDTSEKIELQKQLTEEIKRRLDELKDMKAGGEKN